MKKIAMIIAALIFSATALAENASATISTAAAQTGTYLFAGIGSAKSDAFDDFDYDYDYYGYDLDTSTQVMFRIGAGYEKALSDKTSIGGELAYNHYGSDESAGSYDSNFSNTYSSIDLLARANYYFGSSFRAYAKAGIAQERAKATLDYYYGSDDSTSTNVVPEFGLGVSYVMSDSFTADLGYYIITGDSSDDNAPQISGALLAVNYYL